MNTSWYTTQPRHADGENVGNLMMETILGVDYSVKMDVMRDQGKPTLREILADNESESR